GSSGSDGHPDAGANDGGAKDAAVDTGSHVSSPACGLEFYPPDFPTQCQAALDRACCNAEKACGANADCKKLVACVNACPAPRTDDCVTACAGGSASPPGYPELDAIATCTKGPPYDAGAECNWPN